MRILLTGASGLVGGAVARLAGTTNHHVIGVVGRFAGALPGLAERRPVDLTHTIAVEQLCASARPDAVINCAAVSEPADCVSDPVRAQQLNVALPAALARWCEAHGVRLLHVSTEQVFDGQKAPYRADDPVHPINPYGQSKAEADAVVRHAAPKTSTVLRVPLLMGNSPSQRRSLHERLLADWRTGRTPRLFTDEIRQVAHADSVAAVLLELADRPELSGVFNWAGTTPASRYELGVRLRKHFGLNETTAPIVAVTRTDQPEASRTRPADLRLELGALPSLLRTQPQTLDEQLAQLVWPSVLPRPSDQV